MIRLSTRLNKLNASIILLVWKFSRTAYFSVASLSLAKKAVSPEVDGVSMVPSFMKQEETFLFFFPLLETYQSDALHHLLLLFQWFLLSYIAMAPKKNAKGHVKSKGTLLFLFLFYHRLQVVGMMRSVRLQLWLSHWPIQSWVVSNCFIESWLVQVSQLNAT